MDPRRLRLQEAIAGALGAALVASTFLHWYGTGRARRNAWASFGALDVLLAVVGLMAIALAVLTVAHRTQAVPLAISSLLGLVGFVATVWLAYRVVSPPDLGPGPTAREAGVWVGLGCCLATTLTALWSMRDDRFPHAVADAARVDVAPLPAPPREGGSRP